ncbi:MAG TPA: MFS transporter [Casimicrobiaceae bacterium]|nr:MFS transporter [Casimicrobiaceae bacterium]
MKPSTSRPILAWAMYDWANSVFSVTVISAFFPLFLKQYWSAGVDATTSTFQLGVANAAGGIVVALLSPMLGAISDQGGTRKRFLALFTALAIAMTAGLPFVARGDWLIAIVLYAMAGVGFSGATAFYDALIVDVAPKQRLHQVSALGFALGYLGGGVLFAVNVAMTLWPAKFGLASAAEAVRWSFVMVAVWWALFSIPLFLFVREAPAQSAGAGWSVAQAGLRQLAATLREARQWRDVIVFLVASWLYLDGVGTIARMAVDYGLALGLGERDLILALLITQFIGFPAAIAFGRLGARFGARPMILLGLSAYVLAAVWSYFMRFAWEFYVLAGLVGLVQGGVQLLSRSFFARIIPPAQSAEFFGFYNMVGRVATVVGPLLVGFTALATGSSRASILVIVVLFVAGGVLLLFIDEARALRVVQSSHAEPPRDDAERFGS